MHLELLFSSFVTPTDDILVFGSLSRLSLHDNYCLKLDNTDVVCLNNPLQPLTFNLTFPLMSVQVWHAVGKDKKPLRKQYLEAIVPPFVAVLRRWRPLLAGIHELATADGVNPLAVDDWALAADAPPIEVNNMKSWHAKLFQTSCCSYYVFEFVSVSLLP